MRRCLATNESFPKKAKEKSKPKSNNNKNKVNNKKKGLDEN